MLTGGKTLILRKGYSLLEILLVLTIISGVAFTLLVQIPNHIQEKAITLSADGLLQDLRETQQAAIAENGWYQVKFYPSAGSYKIFKQGVFARTVTLQKGVAFANSPSDIIFNSSGTPNVGLTIMLKSGDLGKKVIVAPVMGRIRVE